MLTVVISVALLLLLKVHFLGDIDIYQYRLENYPPLSRWLFNIGLFSSNIYSISIALGLQIYFIYKINVLLNHFIDDFSINNSSILISILLLHMVPCYSILSPELIFTIIMVFCVNYILKNINKDISQTFCANVGLLLGIAIQFHSIGYFLIIPILYAIVTYYRVSWKNLVVIIFYVFLPFLIYLMLSYILSYPPARFYEFEMQRMRINIFNHLNLLEIVSVSALFLLFVFAFITNWFSLENAVQQEKIFFRIAFVLLLSLGIGAIVFQRLNTMSLLPALFPAVLYITKALNEIKRKWIPEVIVISLFLLLASSSLYYMLPYSLPELKL